MIDVLNTINNICGKSWSSHVALLYMQLIFSGWHILGSVTLNDGADALVFALYREVTASILMYLVVLYLGLRVKVYQPDYIRFLGLGFASFVNVVGTILALQYISASRYALFQPSIPCIASVISIALRFEAFTSLKAAGIACAVAGAVLVETWRTGSSSSTEESNITLGTCLVIAQCSGMACIIVFQKPLLRKYQPSLVTFIYYAIGSCITILLCICWEFRFTVESFYFDGQMLPWLALGYASIFATLINYSIYSYVGKVLSPSVITIYSTFQPIGTAILSMIFLDEMITLSEILGGILVILGLMITVYGRQRELSHPKSKQMSLREIMENDPTYQYESIYNMTESDLTGDSNVSRTIIPFSKQYPYESEHSSASHSYNCLPVQDMNIHYDEERGHEAADINHDSKIRSLTIDESKDIRNYYSPMQQPLLTDCIA